jgi:hypothetical protein
VGSFVDLGIVVRSFLAAKSVAATRSRHSLLSQDRSAIVEEASFFSCPLCTNLLSPHVVVSTLLGEKLFVGATLVHGSFV